MKIKMYSKNNVCLIPTYRCNAGCPFCYAKKFKKIFSRDMSWSKFIDVVGVLRKNGINEISFLGGEPTLWPHIGKAVKFLKNLNIQVNFFTNGIKRSTPAPDCVLINIYNSFSDSQRSKIKNTIAFYKKQGTEIGLRYNLNAEDPRSDKNDLAFFDLAKTLADYISISPAVPYRLLTHLGKRIYDLVLEAKKRNLEVKVSRPIPICVFTREQFNYLRKAASLRTECYSEKNIVINPDGETIFPCVNISDYPLKLPKIKLASVNSAFRDFFENLSCIYEFNECIKCKYSRSHKCQAGCLGMRSRQAVSLATKQINE